MDLFDLVGPVMIGPSSSHTAGAARIGLTARLLLGEEVARRPATLLALRGVDLDDLVPPEEEAGPTSVAYEVADDTPLRGNALEEPAPLLKRLGPVPFWRGDRRCLDALGRIYKRARPVALDAAQGTSIDLR